MIVPVLHVDATVRPESRTAELARWLLGRMGGPVETVRLAKSAAAPLDGPALRRREALLAEGRLDAPEFALARQFAAAERIVLAAPYWDLLFPASLRAYFERVCVVGATFAYDGTTGAPVSLCRARSLVYVCTAGGPAPRNLGFEYVRELCAAFFGIVGKYGAQVQALLKKAEGLDIQTVCPLHGPVLAGAALAKYRIWSAYEAETDGVFVAYTSVYGHTKEAALRLVDLLKARGCPKVGVADLARDDMAEAVEDAFRHSKLVLATTTYNAGIFPFMHTFIDHLVERGFQNRTVGLVENGSWAPLAAKTMRGMFERSKNIRFTDATVHIQSALSDASRKELEALADELCREYVARADAATPKNDPTALFNIGYGLYVVTTKDEKGKDNGLIVNTVTQVSDNPARVAVTINKLNYSHHLVKQTGVLNVNCLSEDAPFEVFQRYGFQSGRTADKFAGVEGLSRTSNGLVVLPRHVCAVLSLKVEQYVDMGSHGMFVCSVAESRVLSPAPAMTYAYYHANVKPKPQPAGGKKGWVCKICGYVHEGETLPDDFICPLCKHGAADFEPLA